MMNLRKRLIVSGLTTLLVCGSAATAQAGVFPWVWNVFFGPADAPWFAPNNGGYYGAAYGPRCGLRRRAMFAPYPAYAPAYSVGTPYGDCCGAGYAPTVSYGYAPAVDNSLNYSTYVVDSGCNSGCGVPVGSVGSSVVTEPTVSGAPSEYEANRPAKAATEGDTETDGAPTVPEGTGDGETGEGESRDGFRNPSTPAADDTGAGEDASEFLKPLDGAPEPAPATEGVGQRSTSPVFVSAEGLNQELADDSPRRQTRTLTRDVRNRMAKRGVIRWISAPRKGLARR